MEQSNPQWSQLWEQHSDDRYISTHQKKIQDNEEVIADYLDSLGITNEEFIPCLLRNKSLGTRTEDDNEELSLLQEVFTLRKDIMISQTEIAARVLQHKLDDWRQQGMSLILFEIAKTIDKFNTDQSKKQLLHIIQMSFEHLIQTYQHIQNFVKDAREKKEAIKIDFQDEQIKLELILRIECEQLDIKPNVVIKEFYKGQSSGQSDQNRSNKLQDLFKIVNRIRDLNPFDMEMKQDFNQDEKLLYKEFLQDKEAYLRLECIPTCFEQVFFKLILLLSVQIYNPPQVMVKDLNIDDINQEIMECMTALNKEFITEDYSKQLAQKLSKIFSINLEKKDTYNELYLNLKYLRYDMIQFNFKEFFELHRKTTDATLKLAGKDIFVLLGSTGTGKSTTLQYLFGSQMINQRINDLAHIAATNIKIPQLKYVSLSPHAKSETRYVAPIEMDLKSIGYTYNKRVIMVDTPGCEDTESQEVNLSNCFGINEAIKNANSVVPIILFSYKNFGARFDKIKANIKYYSQMIKNVPRFIEHFHFFFTHMPDDLNVQQCQNDIIAKFKDGQRNLNDQELHDKIFTAIFNEILNKAEQHRIQIVRPLDQNPLGVWNYLLCAQPLNVPSNVFQMSSVDGAMIKALSQFNIHESHILNALKRGQIDFAAYKFDDLLKFSEIFDEHQNFTERMELVRDNIRRVFTDNFIEGKEALSNWFDCSNQEKSQILLMKYFETLENAKKMEPFRLRYFQNNTQLEGTIPSHAGLTSELTTQAVLHYNSLPKADLLNDKWFTFLQKCKALMQNSQNLGHLFSHYSTLYQRHLKENILLPTQLDIRKGLPHLIYSSPPNSHKFAEEQCFGSSGRLKPKILPDSPKMMSQERDNDSYNGEETKLSNYSHFSIPPHENSIERQIADNIKLIRKIEQTINFEEIKKYANQMICSIESELRKTISYIQEYDLDFITFSESDDREDNSQSQKINLDQIGNKHSNLENYINLLENFIQYFDDKNILEFREYFKGLKKELISIIKIQFLDFKESIQALTSVKSTSDFQIKELFDKMIQLRRIPLVKKLTDGEFQNIHNQIRTIVKYQLDNILKILNDLDTMEKRSLKPRELRQLREAILDLNQLSWINKDDKFRTQEINYRIERQIAEIQYNLIEQFEDYKIELGYHSKISDVYSYASTIQDLKTIAKIIEIELPSKQEIMTEWQEQVKVAFKTINKYLDMFQQGKSQQGHHFLKIQNLTDIVDIFNYLKQLSKYNKLLKLLGGDLKDNTKECMEKIKEGLIQQRKQMKKQICKKIDEIIQSIDSLKQMGAQDLQKMLTTHRSLEEEKNEIRKQVKALEETFKTLNAIKINIDDNVQIFKDTDQIIDKVKEKLIYLQEYFNQIINKDLVNEQKLQYRKKVIILLGEFVRLDVYIDNPENKFKTLHIDCIKTSETEQYMQVNQIQKYLDEREFQQIKMLMDELTGPIQDKQVVDGAIKCITIHISKLIEDSNPWCHEDYYTDQDLKELNDAMKQMIMINKYKIEQYVASKSSLEVQKSCTEVLYNVTKQLYKNLDNQLQHIRHDINNHCLNEAKKRYNNANQTFVRYINYQKLILLDKQNFSEELQNVIDQLENAIQRIQDFDNQFKDTLEAYQKIKFTNLDIIKKKKPCKLINELEIHSTNNAKFKITIGQIKNHIKTFYDGEIDTYAHHISIGEINNDLKKQVEDLVKSLEYLSEDQREQFTQKLNVLKSKLEEREKEESEKILNYIKQNQVGPLIEGLRTLKINVSNQMVDEINQFAIKKFESITKSMRTNTTEALNHKQFEEIFQLRAESITQYFNKITKSKNEEMIGSIQNTFDTMFLSIKSLFSVNELQANQKDSKEFSVQIQQLFTFISLYDICGDESIMHYIPNWQNEISTLFGDSINSLKQIRKDFKVCLTSQPPQINKISQLIKLASKSNVFLEALQTEYYRRNTVEFANFGQPAKDLLSKVQELFTSHLYKEICHQIATLINEHIDTINNSQSFANNERTRHNHKDREAFYIYIEQGLQIIEGLFDCQNDLEGVSLIRQKSIYLKEIETKMKELELSKDEIDSIIQNDKCNEGLQMLGLVYENLICIIKCCPTFAQQASQYFKQVKSSIKLIIDSLYQQANTEIQDSKTLSNILIKIQRVRIHSNIDDLLKYVDDIINAILDNLNYKKMVYLNSLIIELKKSPEGNDLVNTNSYFIGFGIALMNKKVASVSIKTVLEELKGDNLDNTSLLALHKAFKKEYDSQIRNNLHQNMDLSLLIAAIKDVSTKYQGSKFSQNQLNQIHLLVARIFALWTLMRSDAYFKLKDIAVIDQKSSKISDEQQWYLLQPHPAQVISIFRMLCQGFKDDKFNKPTINPHPIKKMQQEILNGMIVDNFVQVKTGEGKSVILAVVSIIFALWGFDVSCACYSSYLSQRDYKDFQDIFQKLNLTPQIFYGTFNQICERYINKDGSMRDLVLNRILNEHQIKIEKNPILRPQVLLIDEVDVFFSKEFYNQQYTPIAEIKNPVITEFLDYLWDNRDNSANLMYCTIIKSNQFLKCKNLFKPTFQSLFIECVKNMLQDLKDYSTHEYHVHNGMIGYKNQDSISTNMRFGYKTLFAYYDEASKGRLDSSAVIQCKSVVIDCALFSYAEIPQYFALTLGVTGTLEALSEQEKLIVKEEFQIKNFTYAPSVYGKNKLIWLQEKQPVIILKTLETYYMEIVENIKSNLKGAHDGFRSCIVFFESQRKLDQFKESPEFAQYQSTCQILNEQVDDSEKSSKVATATYPNKITLATRSFGRGTDFICRDDSVQKNGGIHVIQTFLSELKTEFIQIQGRTARQGEKGSYLLILFAEDLLSFDIDDKQIEDNQSNLVQFLEEKRNFKIMNEQKVETKGKQDLIKQHDKSLEIKQFLTKNTGSDELIRQFLQCHNRGAAVQSNVVKTLILMDATGSMRTLINKTKNSVGVMFECAIEILQDNGLDPDLFLIQFACYRNYSSGPSDILEYSPWESKPQNLRGFMDKIKSSGGQGKEAVEIGLWHANQEAENCQKSVPLAQVFLIGDEAPNTREDVDKKRGDQLIWANTKYEQKTYYETEVDKLKQLGIPVFGFYIHNNAKQVFSQISAETGGVSQFLDVNNEKNGQQQLTDFFVAQILKKIGDGQGKEGLGDKLVNDYKTKFGFVQ